jgi:hypothetical protein
MVPPDAGRTEAAAPECPGAYAVRLVATAHEWAASPVMEKLDNVAGQDGSAGIAALTPVRQSGREVRATGDIADATAVPRGRTLTPGNRRPNFTAEE